MAAGRAERLLELLQLLRRHHQPVTGETLARELGVSLRTLYRDIASLQAQGARIDGAAGLGYLMHDGGLLPPLMFGVEELEALALGSRWVARHGDPALAAAAVDALAKIAAVLPPALRQSMADGSLLVGPAAAPAVDDAAVVRLLRAAMRQQRRLRIGYRDGEGRASERVVWPIALGYFERVRVAVAWCELRGGLRHFRTDRIADGALLPERYPRAKEALLREWREAQAARRAADSG